MCSSDLAAKPKYSGNFEPASGKVIAYIKLNFGLAAGPGVFLKQVSGESSISFDYQLFLGLRLFNLFEQTGFYIEGGMRNHLLLTSDGQLNGTFVSAGAVFTF